MANLDDAVRGVDPHEREPSLGAAGGRIDRSEEQWVLGGSCLGEPAVKRGSVQIGTLQQVAPQPLGLGTRARCEQIVAVPRRIERFEADRTAVM
jgi:hypothetical protein